MLFVPCTKWRRIQGRIRASEKRYPWDESISNVVKALLIDWLSLLFFPFENNSLIYVIIADDLLGLNSISIISSLGTHCSNLETTWKRSPKIFCNCHLLAGWLYLNDPLFFKSFVFQRSMEHLLCNVCPAERLQFWPITRTCPVTSGCCSAYRLKIPIVYRQDTNRVNISTIIIGMN